MPTITSLHAREVLDSRGKPTVECEITTSTGNVGLAIVPSGASTGLAEARELRDGDATRYDGQGVLQAVANVNQVIAPRLIGCEVTDQREIDRRLLELDDSPQKEKLGGNALLAASLATAHAAAASKNVPLYRHLAEVWREIALDRGLPADKIAPPKMPLPMVNMISGGKHAGGNLDFQDVLIQPVGATSFRVGLEWIVRVYRRLGELLNKAGYEGYLVGDEGGFGPRLKSNREAVDFVVQAIVAANLRPGEDINIAIDVASSHFFRNGMYVLQSEREQQLSAEQMIDELASWVAAFPIVSIEDGLAENDWAGWQRLTTRLGSQIRLVGDDLFATNEKLLRRGIAENVGNAVLIKVNQIGTLTETLQTMAVARQAGYACVVSARSGETEDFTIADLAVATAAESIKVGSIVRSERLAKYNRLLRIEEAIE